MSNNPEVNYLIYRVNHKTTSGVKEYLCLDMRYSVDEDTESTIKRSSMMYGFLLYDGQGIGYSTEGKACWHAPATEELETWLQELMLEARFMRSEK